MSTLDKIKHHEPISLSEMVSLDLSNLWLPDDTKGKRGVLYNHIIDKAKTLKELLLLSEIPQNNRVASELSILFNTISLDIPEGALIVGDAEHNQSLLKDLGSALIWHPMTYDKYLRDSTTSYMGDDPKDMEALKKQAPGYYSTLDMGDSDYDELGF